MSGVEVHHLRCPTCGADYGELPLRAEREERDEYTEVRPTRVIPSRPTVLTCRRGHRWSVKTLFRRDGEADQVLLDRFLGGSV